MAWVKTHDGSIVDGDGKVIFFSAQRFIDDICLGNCCFICGARPEDKPFNDEHVIPEWLLRRYALFDRTITLPNGQRARYARHTVPCCQECNSLMGQVIEKPMSDALDGSPTALQDLIAGGNGLQLYVWLGLIFLKLHLKDRAYRKERDSRISSDLISDDFDWHLLHHIHTVVRCFYVPTMIEPEVIGSLMVLPCRQEASEDQFDFGDSHFGQAMFLRLGEAAVFVVFNDSTGSSSFFQENKLDRITGPINELQAREIMADLALLNMQLKERPEQYSELDLVNEKHAIRVRLPPMPVLEGWDHRLRGEVLWNSFEHAWSQLAFAGSTKDEVKEAVLTGGISVLFDADGKFINAPAPTRILGESNPPESVE